MIGEESVLLQAQASWTVELLTTSIAELSVFPFISFNQLCPRISSCNMFLLSSCRNPSWVEAMAKLLELGNIQRYAKIIKIISVVGNSEFFLSLKIPPEGNLVTIFYVLMKYSCPLTQKFLL